MIFIKKGTSCNVKKLAQGSDNFEEINSTKNWHHIITTKDNEFFDYELVHIDTRSNYAYVRYLDWLLCFDGRNLRDYRGE